MSVRRPSGCPTVAPTMVSGRDVGHFCPNIPPQLTAELRPEAQYLGEVAKMAQAD
jgi:hypothetical protein